MFAPWCPTCSSRTLLGPRRVEAVERGPGGPRVVLRCHCGTLLVWSAADDQRPAAAPATAPPPAPVAQVAAGWGGRPRPRT
jgi:hypothetical protein